MGIKHTIGNNVEYIQFEELLKYPKLKHAYIFKSNDMSFRLGKEFENYDMVKNNLKSVSNELEIPYESIVRPDYEHTGNIAIIVEEEEEKPSLSGRNFEFTDGLVTSKTGITLMSTNADCNLLLVYDPVKNVIANVHAGWRGTFQKIAKNAIREMKKNFDCDAKDILVCFCPSIRKCHFEVDEDVANECNTIFNYFRRFNTNYYKSRYKRRKTEILYRYSRN